MSSVWTVRDPFQVSFPLHFRAVPIMGSSSTVTGPTTLGHCPECGKRITTGWVPIEYERDDGRTGRWAEYPGCARVVDPA